MRRLIADPVTPFFCAISHCLYPRIKSRTMFASRSDRLFVNSSASNVLSSAVFCASICGSFRLLNRSSMMILFRMDATAYVENAVLLVSSKPSCARHKPILAACITSSSLRYFLKNRFMTNHTRRSFSIDVYKRRKTSGQFQRFFGARFPHKAIGFILRQKLIRTFQFIPQCVDVIHQFVAFVFQLSGFLQQFRLNHCSSLFEQVRKCRFFVANALYQHFLARIDDCYDDFRRAVIVNVDKIGRFHPHFTAYDHKIVIVRIMVEFEIASVQPAVLHHVHDVFCFARLNVRSFALLRGANIVFDHILRTALAHSESVGSVGNAFSAFIRSYQRVFIAFRIAFFVSRSEIFADRRFCNSDFFTDFPV
nr:MAG TPA: hypothetical protein [Caudoviricetes sp.]